MAVQTLTHPHKPGHRSMISPFMMKMDDWVSRHTPRPRMILSVGMLLLGLFISLLMVLEIVPTSFLFGFIGLALTFSGGVLALYYWGEL